MNGVAEAIRAHRAAISNEFEVFYRDIVTFDSQNLRAVLAFCGAVPVSASPDMNLAFVVIGAGISEHNGVPDVDDLLLGGGSRAGL